MRRPFIDRWRYPILVEYAQRYAQFVSGNTTTFTPKQEEILQVKKDVPGAQLFRTDIGRSLWLGWFGMKDIESVPWRDERVRQAISMLFDRAAFSEEFTNSAELVKGGLPAVETRWQSHVSPGHATYWLDPRKNELGDASKFWKYNPAEANKLLEATGYKDGFTLPAFSNGGNNYGATYDRKVEITLDMWQKGTKIKVNQQRPMYTEWFANYYNSPTRDFSDVAFWTNNLVRPDIDQDLFSTWHSKSGATFKGFKDARVDDLIEQQRKELDPQKRISIIHDLQRYLAPKMYAIPWEPLSSSYYFRWPWLRNSGFPGYDEWLSADMPRRNG